MLLGSGQNEAIIASNNVSKQRQYFITDPCETMLTFSQRNLSSI